MIPEWYPNNRFISASKTIPSPALNLYRCTRIILPMFVVKLMFFGLKNKLQKKITKYNLEICEINLLESLNVIYMCNIKTIPLDGLYIQFNLPLIHFGTLSYIKVLQLDLWLLRIALVKICKWDSDTNSREKNLRTKGDNYMAAFDESDHQLNSRKSEK